MIKQALLSVSDKTGIVDFARTRCARRQAAVHRRHRQAAGRRRPAGHRSADYTGFPEMLDGRVKTLHPKVHGGILARRDLPEHMAASRARHPDHRPAGGQPVPVPATVAKADCTLEDAIENIDIGGPAMLRSAAKNHKDVIVISTDRLRRRARRNEGRRRPALRHPLRLATKASPTPPNTTARSRTT
jgi:phosphoribosylaminoimidazolecarboxamide formyltransferase/IMP cyclohydrolase